MKKHRFSIRKFNDLEGNITIMWIPYTDILPVSVGKYDPKWNKWHKKGCNRPSVRVPKFIKDEVEEKYSQ